MAAPHLESCLTYIQANRTIADNFAAKAKSLVALAQRVAGDDIDERLRLADLLRVAEDRAALHSLLANEQEQFLGVRCLCPNVTGPRDFPRN